MKKPSASRITERYFRKVAAEDVPPISAAKFIDLINFEVALTTYAQWLVSQDKKSDTLLTDGKTLLRRVFSPLKGGIKRYLGDVSEDAPGAIRTAYNRALMGKDIRAAQKHVDFFAAILPWLMKRRTILENIFGSQRAIQTARRVAVTIQEEGIQSRLNKSAGIIPASQWKIGRQWIIKAAEKVGGGLTDTEIILGDASIAQSLGTQLQEIDSKIAQVDPNTPQSAELEEERINILEQLELIKKETPDKSVVLAAAASAQKPDKTYATKTGQDMSLSDAQEDAMQVQGRAIIAAGAGSGKTRVLAAKVGYHIKELGIPPSSIMATSFTRKSSAELIKRIEEKAGVKLDRGDMGGFGTTHSIAGGLLNTSAREFKRANGYFGAKEGWKQVTLLRLAMEQVRMGSGGIQPPAPVGLWENKAVGTKSPGRSTDVPPEEPVSYQDEMDDYKDALEDAIGYAEFRTRKQPQNTYWQNALKFLKDHRDRDPKKMTPKQKGWMNKLFAESQKSPRARMKGFRVAEEGKKHKLKDKVFFKRPAGQWFNLGRSLTRGEGGKEKPIPLGEFKNSISILKGKGVSPSQAWAGEGGYDPESDQAAVYAAYEWLKGPTGEPEYASTGDMDDILIDTVTALVASPRIRRQIQQRFKVVLVDEAQDLNQVQHHIFGLITGYLDPQTLKPDSNKKMSANTYTLIGDDKQAIYEFRGADPEEFIDKSNLTEGGDDFDTKLLETNYRSGAAIVNAAQRLIDHNEKQVPMVCKAFEDRKGTGQILTRREESVEDAAISVAEDIVESMKMADTGETKYSDFGVGVRSNAEAYEYGLEMLKRGIPFKSNARFFSDPNTKALIGWLTLIEQGLDSRTPEALQGLADATRAPYSGLGSKKIKEEIENRTPLTMGWGNWLIKGGFLDIYQGPKWSSKIAFFANLVNRVSQMEGTPESLLSELLSMEGFDGKTTMETLTDNVRENDEIMAQLSAESMDGIPSEDQIIEMAMAPVNPLIGLATSQENLEGAMQYVRKLQRVNEKITSRDTENEIDRDAVTIGTMHSWKGLECPNMYVPMVGGKFPRTGVTRDMEGTVHMDSTASEGPDLWSERRLAYVAITRAEDRCVLLDIPHPKFGVRSQFIGEACAPIEGERRGEDEVTKMGSAKWPDELIDQIREEEEI